MRKSSFSPVPTFFLPVSYSARTNLRCAGSGRYGSSAARAGAANRLRGRNRGMDAPSTAAGSCPGVPTSHLLVFIGLAGSTKSFDRAGVASGRLKSASDCPKSASGGLKSASDCVELASGGLKSASGCVESASGGVELASGGAESASGGLKSASGCVESASGGVKSASVGVESASVGAELSSGRGELASGGWRPQ